MLTIRSIPARIAKELIIRKMSPKEPSSSHEEVPTTVTAGVATVVSPASSSET
jgi:hypothetical protein